MGIRTRYEDAVLMLGCRRYESALKDALLAFAATSRKRRPNRKKVSDRRAFEELVHESVYPMIGGGDWTYEGPNGEIPLSTLLYKYVRCPIVHESEFDDFVSCVHGESLIEICGVTGNVLLTDSFTKLLLTAVRTASENKDVFPRNMYEAIPKPPLLTHLAVFEFAWGPEHYRFATGQAAVVTAPWGNNLDDRTWLRCNCYQQFNGSSVELNGSPISALIPIDYITAIKRGQTIRLIRSRETTSVGVFPPDFPAPSSAMPVEEIISLVSGLQVDQPPGWDVAVVYPELRQFDRDCINCWSPLGYKR